MKTFLQKALEILIGRAGDGPWRSKSVLAALAVVVAGFGIWFHSLGSNLPPGETGTANLPASTHWNWSKPFPFYVPIGVSYVAGFCIGWFFRKLIRMILAVIVLVVALLAVGKFAGCDVTPAQERVKRTGEWAQREVTTAKDYLQHLLPSAGGGGAGAYLGFLRRGKAAAPKPGTETNPPPK